MNHIFHNNFTWYKIIVLLGSLELFITQRRVSTLWDFGIFRILKGGRIFAEGVQVGK